MGDLIRFSDYVSSWTEILTVNAERSTLHVYTNRHDEIVEIVQVNDEGEAIMTTLRSDDIDRLASALAKTSFSLKNEA